MLEIYVDSALKDVVELNDYYFNINTYQRVLSEKRLQDILKTVEQIDICGERVISKITNEPISLSHISTGCKTLLNIVAFPQKIFSIVECGENVLSAIYKLKEGRIYCRKKLLPYEDIDNKYKLFYESSVFVFNNLLELERWWDFHDSQAVGCE